MSVHDDYGGSPSNSYHTSPGYAAAQQAESEPEYRKRRAAEGCCQSVTSEPTMLREMRAQRDILLTRVNTLNMRIDVLRQFIALFEEV